MAHGRENIAEMIRWIGQKNQNVGLISLSARQNYPLSIRSIWFLSLIFYIFFKVFCSNGIKTVKSKYFYVILMDFVEQNLAQKYYFTNLGTLG